MRVDGHYVLLAPFSDVYFLGLRKDVVRYFLKSRVLYNELRAIKLPGLEMELSFHNERVNDDQEYAERILDFIYEDRIVGHDLAKEIANEVGFNHKLLSARLADEQFSEEDKHNYMQELNNFNPDNEEAEIIEFDNRY